MGLILLPGTCNKCGCTDDAGVLRLGDCVAAENRAKETT